MTGSYKQSRQSSERRFGFTLIELLVVIAIIALLVSILLPALSKTRKYAKLLKCVSQQRQLSVAQLTYASDFKDALSGFSWTAPALGGPGKWGPEAAQAGVPTNFTNDLAAASAQAVAIMRLRSVPRNTTIPVPAGWVPHIRYSHIPLYDYIAQRLPEPTLVCPDDWRQRGFIDNPSVTPSLGIHQLYASSYNFTPAFYTPNRETTAGWFRQDSSQRIFNYAADGGRYKLGKRKGFEIKFPSQKVWIFDEYDRHENKVDTYFTHFRAKPTVILGDGSSQVVKSHEANLGGYLRPNNIILPANIQYVPTEFPLVPWPDTSNMLQDGRYRWTLGGLGGRDIGGPRPF